MGKIKPYDIYIWMRFSNDWQDVNNRRFVLTGVHEFDHDDRIKNLWSCFEFPGFRSGMHKEVQLYEYEIEKDMIYMGNLFDLLGKQYGYLEE